MTGRGSRRLGVEDEELKSDGSIAALPDMRASPRRWGQEGIAVRVDDKTSALFGRVASYFAKRESEDDKALAAKLTRIAEGGEVGTGDGLTNADANVVQGRLNVLHEMAKQSGPQAADARTEAKLLVRYQAVVGRLRS